MEPAAETIHRDKIATVNKKGERVWIYPQRVDGPLYRWRIWLSSLQLCVLIGLPFIKINGKPAILLNVAERKFILFGNIFWPEDLYIFGLIFITMVVFLLLVTATVGRVFCGWICPQTVFLETVFRRLDRLFEGSASQQRKSSKEPSKNLVRKITKHIVFYGISFFVANIFLAYFIGIESLREIVTSPPTEHLKGFIAICLFSFVFYGVFSWFREQACIMVCPYGRLQSMLQGPETITISYDFKRGEPRGRRLKKNKERELGDCIDCKKCVSVCPTGIDIRNGLQMECVNCTFCVDACNDVMEKVGKPKGLIRYASQDMIETSSKYKISARTISYAIVFLVLISIDIFILSTRPSVHATIMRMPGSVCTKLADGAYMNVYGAVFTNKTFKNQEYELRILGQKGEIRLPEKNVAVASESTLKITILIVMPAENVKQRNMDINVGMFYQDRLLFQTKVHFQGP